MVGWWCVCVPLLQFLFPLCVTNRRRCVCVCVCLRVCVRMQEGLEMLHKAGVKVDLVYVDGDHHYDGAYADIENVLQ